MRNRKKIASVLTCAVFTATPITLRASLNDDLYASLPRGAFKTTYTFSDERSPLSPPAGPSLSSYPPSSPQTPVQANTVKSSQPVPPVKDDEIIFEADEVTRQDEQSPIIASGNVRAFFERRYLHADRVSYDPTKNIVIAEGNVSITDDKMETVFADRFVLTGDLRDGIAENFSALLAENARLAGDNAVREQGARTRIRKAAYTACKVCTSNGDAKTPTWRIRALKVTRDQERRVVRFHHAFFELKGIPILYTPYVQGPDPSVERQSGFLTPLIGGSSRLGFNVELPYYFAFSNHTDATLFPKYTSNEGVLWQGELRRRGKNSYNVLSGGIINVDNTTTEEEENPNVSIPGVRWNIFGRGYRDFGPNWRLGYDIERISDDTFLRNFDIRRRGDLRKELDTTNSNRLKSQVYANWNKGGSNLSINTFLFQGLRAQDVAERIPYVLPLTDFQHDVGRKIGGGNVRFNANFASLQRTKGLDTRRFSASAYWEREKITKNGHRLKAFAEVRGDTYFFQDLDEGNELTLGQPISDEAIDDPTKFVGRFAPTGGLEWSYPLTNRIRGARLFIEPRAQLVVSRANQNPNSIINEDAQSVEFDYTGLFDYNKSTGFDRFEDGQRVNIGVQTSAIFDNGLNVEGSIGQQYRIQNTGAFDEQIGLGQTRSDLVGELNFKYKSLIGMQNRFRIDDESFSINRAESLAYVNFGRFSGNVNYVRLSEESDAGLDRREELTARMRLKLTRNWSAGASWRENLQAATDTNGTIRQDFLLEYRDECSSLGFIYRQDQTRDAGLKRDNAILVQFTLRSLVDSPPAVPGF